ncbi:MAG: radical SAM protein [Acidobacteriota bacterium]
MKVTLPHRAEDSVRAPGNSPPQAAFEGLETLWIQITGTLCNLRCSHCFISCSPDNHTLEFMSRAQIQQYLREAEEIGVKELYFTGGEPFLHAEIFDILADALAVAPTTVLTNGVLITDRFARSLGKLAAASPYSLEVRVSLDAADEGANDAIRGAGVFRKAVRGLLRLQDAGLLPIVTATELVVEERGRPLPSGSGAETSAPQRCAGEVAGGGQERLRAVDGASSAGRQVPVGVDADKVPAMPRAGRFYRQFHDMLAAAGVRRPRIKILPVFNMGMLDGRGEQVLLSERMLDGFDTATLQCSASRLVAADGVYACPILAGEPAARISTAGLRDALRPCSLYHPSCTTCYLTGMTCRNS